MILEWLPEAPHAVTGVVEARAAPLTSERGLDPAATSRQLARPAEHELADESEVPSSSSSSSGADPLGFTDAPPPRSDADGAAALAEVIALRGTKVIRLRRRSRSPQTPRMSRARGDERRFGYLSGDASPCGTHRDRGCGSAIVAALALGSFLLAAGCTSARQNAPHLGAQPPEGYRFSSLRSTAEAGQPDPDRAFVILTFSGGGTRAAAFAYGVMTALRDSRITDDRSMLDEVDVISSVSGGSFVAAYYGLFGPAAFFEHFPQDVLFRSIETDLALRLISPWNWPALASTGYSRGTLAADYYDQTIFKGRTYADMPRRRPLIIINATDLGQGQQFRFVQDQFDAICSDLDPLPVAYAVLASSAFPVAFTPLTLRNFRSEPTCPQPEPQSAPLIDLDEADWARALRVQDNARLRPYLHLADGGLSDNLGAAAIDGGFLLPGPIDDPFNRNVGLAKLIDDGAVKKVVIIAVDARTGVQARMDEIADPPSIFSVLDSAVGAPMSTVSANTVTGIRRQMQASEKDQFEDLTRPCRPNDAKCERRKRAAVHAPGVTFVHVSLDLIRDDATREKMQSVGTRLQLPVDQILELVDWGRRLLLDSQEYANAVSGVTLATAGTAGPAGAPPASAEPGVLDVSQPGADRTHLEVSP